MTRIRHLRTAATVAALAVVAVGGCSSGGSTGDSSGATAGAATPTATTSPTPPPTAAPTVRMAASSLGRILVDEKGRTLYLYTKDTVTTSVCEGQCLAAWPALVGKPRAGAGVDATALGTTTRSDGSTQATYAGHPLYYFAKDAAAGDVTGQDVGKVWYVLGADGSAITAAASVSSRPTPSPTSDTY